MFGLKKYKVIKSFNGYREGMQVAFNGSDAEKYAAYIVSANKPVVATVLEEVKEPEQAPIKQVRRGRKGRK